MLKEENKLKSARPRILVVDDEMMMRVLVCESLRQAGFEPIEAANGEDAIGLIQECEPDLILLDVLMPGMSGFEVCSWLRGEQNDQATPVLIMTGLEDVSSIDRAYDTGATDFITKPLNYPILTHRIRYILRQKEITDQLRISEERLALTQQTALLGHWETIPGDPFVYVSNTARSILGESFEGSKISKKKLFGQMAPDDVEAYQRQLQIGVDTASRVQFEFILNKEDGGQRIVFLDLEPLVKNGEVVKIVGVFQDISDRRNAEKHIYQLSNYDEVTGLANRARFLDKALNKIKYANERRKSVAVFMLGLDNFKVVHQSLGHAEGNQLLIELSKRLERFVRTRNSNKNLTSRAEVRKNINPNCENDLLASLGGDEFALALWGVRQAEEAGWIASTISHLIKAPIDLNGQEIVVTCSIGITFFPLDGSEPDMLLKNAEVAMHYAKSAGKDCYQLFSESMSWQSTRRLKLEADMRQAVENQEFSLHYQPKVKIADGRVSGVEALIRWDHPEQGFVSPGEFIPVAEETGQILQIGKWVLETACKQAKAWADQGTPLCISVNVSMLQLRDYEFCELVSSMLQKYQLESSLIQLELVESMLMDSMDDNSQKMQILRDLGVTIAIDDFGTGYSSMAYLSQLPLDVLKIDKSFIDLLLDDENPVAIVEATIALAHALELKVVAEGVEQEVQVKMLSDLGCDEIQGYYYSRPLNVDDFDLWIADFMGSPQKAKGNHISTLSNK